MGNRKGQKHYPERIKQIIIAEQKDGKSVSSLSAKHGISRYTIQSWCGLRPEVKRRQMMPLKRGRPTNKPEDLEKKVKRLEMESELLRNFLQDRPNLKWCTDIFYISTKEGFVYLSVIKDLYDNFVVAYKVGIENNNNLVFETVKAAKREVTAELQLHSDQGFQYTSDGYF